MTRLKDIPQLQADGRNLKEVAEAVREVLQTFRGYRGDKRDRALTLRDLDAATARSVLAGGTVGGGGGNTVVIPGGGGGGGSEYEPDLTPPPTAEGLAVTAGIGQLYIECDTPTYTQGHGHDRTVVYGAKWLPGDPEPTFSSAVELFQFQGTFSAYPSDPATTWCIWIKWRSMDGVLSVSPAGGTNGVQATTGQDVDLLLEALTGSITESQLFGDLGDRIDLIDGVMPGSVNARLGTKNATFFQNAEPTATAVGDIWIEAGSGNLLLFSEEWDAAAWTKNNVSVTTNAFTAPDATMTADRITRLSGVNSSIYQMLPSEDRSGIAHSFLVHLCADSVSEAAVRFFYSGGGTPNLSVAEILEGPGSITGVGTVEATVTGLTSSWTRVRVITTPASSGAVIGAMVRTKVSGAAGDSLGVWGAQVVQGTDVVPYQMTTTAPADGVRGRIRTWDGTAWVLSDDRRIVENAAAIIEEAETRADEDAALATSITAVVAAVDDNAAAVVAEATARADADAALASSISTVAAAAGDNTAAIEAEATARASETGALFAKYTVKIDVNGYVSGFGLASEANNATPTSTFQVRADSFAISSPSGPGITPVTPFVVQTTPGTVNGVSVPVGVYMDAAYIKNGTIVSAKIGNAQIDDAKVANLSAAKLTVGDGTVGGNLRSSNYVAGTSGWIVTPAGAAEFSDATVRGTVYATAGQIGGITIASNAVRAGQSAFNTGSGFYLGADGRFSLGSSSGNRLTWDGSELNITGGGTFSGALSAATGTFVGNVSAGQFTTGAFVGAAWPAAGNYGTYLGPWGLMIGNANNNKYLQVTHEGNIYAPAFTVINGVMTVSQANVIDTLNIASGAVASTWPSTGSAATIYLPITVPSGQTHRVAMVCVQNGGGSFSSPLAASSISCNGITVPVHAGSVGSTGGDNDSTLWGYNSTTLAFVEDLTGPTTKTYAFSGLSGYNKTMIAQVLKRPDV